MEAFIWKDRDVAAAFLNERSLLIPDRPRQLEVMLRVLRSAGMPMRRVLDLGCGDGILLGTILQALPESSGIALDFSPLMLEQAQRRLEAFPGRCVVAEADLLDPAWQRLVPGPFEAVVSGFAIHHLPHPRKRELYAEVFALLAPGGVFLNLEHIASATPRGEQMFDDTMAEHLYQRRRERGEEVTLEQVHRDFLERPDRAANILATVEEQCQWLRDIGFADVDCFWRYFELAVFGGFRPKGA
jgi:SAM-dependent methyltransferase